MGKTEKTQSYYIPEFLRKSEGERRFGDCL